MYLHVHVTIAKNVRLVKYKLRHTLITALTLHDLQPDLCCYFPYSKITSSTPRPMEIGDQSTPLPQFSGRLIGRMAWVMEISRKIGKRAGDWRQRETPMRDTTHK